ncbi:MAG: response regulator [Candidatus Omnitrophota bacterium]|nr:response regulator [Candidatus Omnitrophota bacterium]
MMQHEEKVNTAKKVIRLYNMKNENAHELEKLQFNKRDEMPLAKKQIFIVDDDVSVCRALSVLLITYGFSVDTFTSAEDFFCAVPNSVPGCLILDIHMPGLGGWEAQQRLLRSGSKRPVIIISADKDGAPEQRALKAGAVGLLQKPFSDKELVDLIDLAFL